MKIDFAVALVNPPFELVSPASLESPLIVASPHSGRDYPDAFVAASRLDAAALRQSEDFFVDQLFQAAQDIGAHMLAARFPRAYCDANREPYELDPNMYLDAIPQHANTRSPRVSGGLGTIAKVVASKQEIYGGKLPYSEAARRIRRYYHPYHDALSTLIEDKIARFGSCVLLDGHSMPPLRRNAGDPGGPGPDFVLGDRFGTSCHPALTDCITSFLTDRGYRVARNTPYAGGFTTSHYGRPNQGIHALQIEICRSRYMDPENLSVTNGFAGLQADLSDLLGVASAFAQQLVLPDAAE